MNEVNKEEYHPPGMERMPEADGVAIVKGLCGDTMEMYLSLDSQAITQAMFYTDGCKASRICGHVAVSLARGKTLMEVLRLSPADVIDAWKDVPRGNAHCAILAINTLHKALAGYLLRDGAS